MILDRIITAANWLAKRAAGTTHTRVDLERPGLTLFETSISAP